MYEDFKVKAKEGDVLHIVRYGLMPETTVFVSFDGEQLIVPDDQGKPVHFYEADTLESAQAVFEYTRKGIPGVMERIDPDKLNPYHMAIYSTEVSEAHARYSARIRNLWNRVPIEKVLDYIERIGEYADFYDGVSEHGYDDKPMICANWNPPKMKRLGDWIEKFYHGNIEVDWSDEWMRCECGKAVRSQADSYGWEPSFLWVSDCEFVCRDCAANSMDDVLEHYMNKKTHALPSWVMTDVEEAGFTCLESEDSYCTRFESGFHRGQDDTPEKAVKLAKEILPYKFDYLFVITDCGQFDIKWTMMVRKQEVEEEV